MILKFCTGILFVSSLFIVSSDGQSYHMLKYVNHGANSATTQPQFVSSATSTYDQYANIGNMMLKANIICVTGLWALYNTTDFGARVEDYSTVISIRGTDLETCSKPGQLPILKNVFSVAYLGNRNYDADGIQIFSQPYLLGGFWDATATTDRMLPRYITGFSLGSLAITGTSSFLLCGDLACSVNTVCVDMRYYGKLFLQRNPAGDTSVMWPKVIRRVQVVSSSECANHPHPARPTSRQRLVKRDVTAEGIEISVYKPSF